VLAFGYVLQPIKDVKKNNSLQFDFSFVMMGGMIWELKLGIFF
jgi:hypothetical protein